jgi:SAM-dependent methyltransferase
MEIDWDALADFLEQGADLRRSVNDGAAGWLRDLTTATRAEANGSSAGAAASAGAPPALGEVGDVVRLIIDVGSGPGVMSTVFAGLFPAATVIAADGAPGLLDRARARAERAGVADRVGTLLVDLPDGFDELALAGPADIVWAGAALHHLGDQTDALRQLGGLLRPGGLVAVLEGGLQTRFLPRDIGFGRPGLQSRLDAVMEDWFAEMRASLPGARPEVEDWPAMFAAAGLRHVGTRSFLVDVPPPGDKALREHVRVDLARLRDLIGDRLDPADVDTVDRLLDAADPAGLLRRTDVFLLTARTLHVGRRARHS